MSSLKDFFLNLNVFESSTDDDQIQDARQRRIYIIASRIYFIILISILIIVGIVSSLVRQITIVTVQNPSIDQFMHLPYDANCPCSRSSIPYEEFISIEVGFQQICSSDFISDRWIKTISSDANSTYFDPQDFRTYGSAQFQALADFCRLSATTAQQEINSYISNSLFSSQVVFPDVLLIQITIFIAQLRMKMLNDFEAQLQLIRKMTMGNRLISGLQTNNIQIYENIGNSLMRIYPYPIQYQDSNGSICDCTLVVDCVAVSGIFNSFNVPTQFDLDNDFTWMRVPGISSGCLPVNSILLSTLECFYNQTCVDQLVEYFSTTERFTAMNSNESSRFNSNSMVQSLLNNLMIEYWIENVSYSAYYSQCAPIVCTYTKSERNSFVFVLTQLISILGGMKILLGFIIPFPIRSMQRLRNADQSPQTSRK